MEHPNKYLEDDKHLCIRCKNTIIGLDNYVLHRKNECQEPFSSSPTDLAHLTRDSEVGERYGIPEKPQVETDRVSETFSDDVIDLSTNTKRNFHSAGHSATILFPSSSSLDSNSAEQKESSKLCKTYNTESYSEPYGDIDTYQNHFISNRDQPIFIDYRNSGTEQSRKEMFATPNNYSSSSDIFHQEHQEPSGISLFRSFESFNESFKNNQDIVHGNYLSQTANKYIGEVSNFDNKSPEIYSVSENESFLGSDNHSKSNPYKSKLLSNPIDEAERQNFQKQNYYEEEISKNKLDDTNIPECGTKNSCSNDAVDFSKQEDIRQNDFLSSLELTSNVTKKIMKYELDIEDDEDYDDSRPPSHYTGGKWPPGTDPHLRESGKWIFSPRSVEEDCQDDFDELNENAIEQQSFQPPPPSYTKGKWLPGKRMIDSNKYNLDEDYDCKSCSRTLKGKAAYERHIHSESHFVKDKKICQENNSESLNKRPIRATKQQAQIFLKQKISLIKNKRNKMKVSKILESNIPEAEMKVEFEEKIAPSKYEEMSDESDPEEKLNKNKYTKILCPICRLSFSIVYSSQHFASLAHIHNELEFNQKPNNEIRKKYDKIILKNIEPFIKTSYFLCKPCKFYTNSHDDFEAHFNLHEDECQSSQTRIIFSCSACPDETDLYSLRDLQRHLQVSQHRKNVRYEIFQVRQIVLTYNIEILCILCNQAFRYNKAYQNHRRIFHEEKSFQLVNQRLSQCPECSYQGTTERIVRIHLKKEHKINCSSSYFCFVCGLKFDTSSKADSHRHSVDHRIIIDKYKGKPNERTCSICYLNVANISLLRQHMNDEHRKELTPCFYCGLVFPLRADLTAHRKNCPQVISLLDGIYKCDLCSFSNDLLSHVLMHTLLVHFEKEEAKLYSCHICKTRIQGRSMKNHMLLHTKELKYSCVHCSRRFSEEEWLEKHLTAVHSSLVKRKRCGRAEEDKTLSSDRKGIGGKNVQKESKRFLCEICGKTYGSKSHMKRHQNEQHVEGIVAMETESLPVNTKICDNKQAPSSKSLMCEVCGALFGNSTLLKTHRQKHRNNGDDGETYPCPHCSYSTPRIHHLKRHLRLHTGATPFQCPYCSYKANNQENLRKHMLKTQRHFGRFMYECQLCLQKTSEEGRVSSEFKREEKVGEEEEEEGQKEGVSRPFGCNFASAFKEHLIRKHQTHFRDKDEVSRHIRSYYHAKSDLTFTENPKLFKYKFKKRVRKSRNETSSSNVDEKLMKENNYISEDIKPFDITHQHLNQLNIDINRQGGPLREEMPPSDLTSFLPSSSTNIISSSDDGDKVTLSVNDMQLLTSFSQGKMLSFPSCSYKREEKIQIPSNSKRIRVFMNKESKKTYILKNDVTVKNDIITDDFKEDLNIPIGAEVILRDSQEMSNISLTEQQLQTDLSGKQTLCIPQVSVGVQDVSSDSWHGDQVWVQQEEKVQNVVSKKVYLLVSNEKDIETQIKNILPSLQ